MVDILRVFKEQKNYFLKGETLPLENRIKTLKQLKEIIKVNEDEIIKALKKDLNKSDFEAYATEIGIVYDEINLHIKNIKKWAKREGKRSPIVHFPAKSYIYKEPYGVTLIIGPFNYPFQLIFAPLIGAISAGNTAILKPSEHTVNTALIIEKIINDNFEEGLIRVVNPLGGKEVVSYLLDLTFDYIFFTGSVAVGKIVMERASKNLIPITLELGGKSPCIVDETANIKMAARRIVWGKLLNAGQTCVAPDYIYVNKAVKEALLRELVNEVELQYGVNPKDSPDYPRLVNRSTVERLIKYLHDGDIYFGGDYDLDSLYLSPTIIHNIKDNNNNIMVDELFGPILPVIEFEDIKEVIGYVNSKDKPLALYYFSEDANGIEYVLKNTSAGGVTINDTIIHVASPYLPFGGVGTSGIGAYHGKASFDTFTHRKAVIKRGTFIEFSVRYAPFRNKVQLLKKLMK